jgi:hypothetical protein
MAVDEGARRRKAGIMHVSPAKNPVDFMPAPPARSIRFPGARLQVFRLRVDDEPLRRNGTTSTAALRRIQSDVRVKSSPLMPPAAMSA